MVKVTRIDGSSLTNSPGFKPRAVGKGRSAGHF